MFSSEQPSISPVEIRSLVATLSYKPGWRFKIGGPLNGSLCVFATTADSWHPQRQRCTQHMFPIPAGLADERALIRWLFDCLLLCELHEAGEFFTVDGRRSFYPNHQDEGSPYERVERWEDHHGVETVDTPSA